MKPIVCRCCLSILVTAVFWAIAPGCARNGSQAVGAPKRIVSLAPSITETLFALGLGDRVVGVTTFCTYPPQAKNIDKIGGYFDPNLEKIVGLHPDLVILLREHEKQRTYLSRFGVSVLSVDNSTCASVCSSFASIGRRCQATHASDSLIGVFRQRLAPLASPVTPSRQRLRVLLCVGRDGPTEGKIRGLYAAGRGTFYSDLLTAAGAENAYPDTVPAYPRLSEEGIVTLSPDLVIDVASSMGNYACSLLVKDWRWMQRVPAVQHNDIYCLSNAYSTVPGPRMLLLLEDLSQIVNDASRGRDRKGTYGRPDH